MGDCDPKDRLIADDIVNSNPTIVGEEFSECSDVVVTLSKIKSLFESVEHLGQEWQIYSPMGELPKNQEFVLMTADSGYTLILMNVEHWCNSAGEEGIRYIPVTIENLMVYTGD